MPLYYFDLFDGDELVRDEFGVELDSLYEAREQAIALLPDLARDELPESENYEFVAIVRCREGRVRYRATLSLRGGWVEPPAHLPLERR